MTDTESKRFSPDGSTDARLSEAIEMVNAATPGPWVWYNGCSWWRLGLADQSEHARILRPRVAHDGHPDLDSREDDRKLIAFAGTHLPTILTALAAYRAALRVQLSIETVDVMKELARAALAIPIFADEETA